jgi:hypothetical protein
MSAVIAVVAIDVSVRKKTPAPREAGIYEWLMADGKMAERSGEPLSSAIQPFSH